MAREAAASFQLSGKDRNPGSCRNHVSNPGVMSMGQVDHGQSLCWNVLMARPECLDGLGWWNHVTWIKEEGTKKEPCLLIPGTELLGGKQTLLTI